MPSLRDEIETFLNEHQIVDVTQYSKNNWKAFVKEKIISKNRQSLLEMAKNLKKADYFSLACEDFKIKDYFSELNLDNVRMKFRERSQCIKTCRSHASSDFENMKALYQCYHCSNQDVLSHWWVCESYKHLRINKNKNSDADVCEFYRAVIKLRQSET